MALDVAPRERHLSRALLPLGLVFLAVGVSAAVVGPFLSLFLSTAVHAGPLQVTLFLVAQPLAGVISSTLVGGLSDRFPIRRKLLIGASLAGLVGTALTAVVRDYWILLALAVTVTALAGLLYPQTFAYARQVLSGETSSRAALGISSLRTVFSTAWVAGPPLAAFLLELGGFTLIYSIAAVMYGVAAIVGVLLLKEIDVPGAAPETTDAVSAAVTGGAEGIGGAEGVGGAVSAAVTGDAGTSGDAGRAGDAGGSAVTPGMPRWALLLSALAFTLLQCPMTLCVQAMPLFIRTDLHADAGNAGLVLGLCAALEIPLMLGLGALTARIPLRPLVLAGAACGALYYLSAAMASSVRMLFAAQFVNATFIAAVTGLGISYMQELLPTQPGRATTLFTNSFPIGAMLAGPLFGLAQHFGYRLAYGTGAVLAACGLLVLLAVRPGPSRSAPEQPAT